MYIYIYYLKIIPKSTHTIVKLVKVNFILIYIIHKMSALLKSLKKNRKKK